MFVRLDGATTENRKLTTAGWIVVATGLVNTWHKDTYFTE